MGFLSDSSVVHVVDGFLNRWCVFCLLVVGGCHVGVMAMGPPVPFRRCVYVGGGGGGPPGGGGGGRGGGGGGVGVMGRRSGVGPYT